MSFPSPLGRAETARRNEDAARLRECRRGGPGPSWPSLRSLISTSPPLQPSSFYDSLFIKSGRKGLGMGQPRPPPRPTGAEHARNVILLVGLGVDGSRCGKSEPRGMACSAQGVGCWCFSTPAALQHFPGNPGRPRGPESVSSLLSRLRLRSRPSWLPPRSHLINEDGVLEHIAQDSLARSGHRGAQMRRCSVRKLVDTVFRNLARTTLTLHYSDTRGPEASSSQL
ncbi:hypothetical protein B0J13DRAFT_280048 [Dactylonectria estremocensis]|uniref:Uncharacterized protein n=1 Tax=Dactylonectria estremocensis TaxID=1079267 RepID=A0A9P9JA45_9HYPO|nr:hypothetical protein B0J13DRAFT_280048 [Dactylonectria estremocensis]